MHPADRNRASTDSALWLSSTFGDSGIIIIKDIIDPSQSISIIVHDPGIFQEQSVRVNAHIFTPEHLHCPLLALRRNPVRQLIPPLFPGFSTTIPQEEFHYAIKIQKTIVERNEMLPCN